jgi:sialic acid synthase SpsE
MTDDFSNQVSGIASTYSTDTIFILGKGPSANAIDPAVFAGSLVIGINDAERIFPVDISVFHAEWVAQSVQANGLKSRLYVSSVPFNPGHRAIHRAAFMPLRQDTTDLLMQRFQSDDFVIEEILFLSALRIARLVAEKRGRPQTVYMVGFDFDAKRGYAQALAGSPITPDDGGAAHIDIQEHFFVNTLYILRNSVLDVVHVGSRAFSQITPEELNALFKPQVARRSTEAHSVLIVAELTTNHFGDRSRLERMIRASAAAGADFVKLQKRDVETFYTAEQLRAPYVSPFGKTFADYRHALELNEDDFTFVDRLCAELGISWFASLLDQPSFEWMQRFDPRIVKLPSTISEHRDYLAHVARNYSGSIVLSTGMTDRNYENWVLQTFGKCDLLYLMQANSAYPTPQHDCNVGVVRHYHTLSRNHTHIVPAYSSHDFGWLASALAVAAGARMVEKHVKLGNTEWAHFDAVAVDLTTSAFRDYVAGVRDSEMIVGSETKKVNESEFHKYRRSPASNAVQGA